MVNNVNNWIMITCFCENLGGPKVLLGDRSVIFCVNCGNVYTYGSVFNRRHLFYIGYFVQNRIGTIFK